MKTHSIVEQKIRWIRWYLPILLIFRILFVSMKGTSLTDVSIGLHLTRISAVDETKEVCDRLCVDISGNRNEIMRSIFTSLLILIDSFRQYFRKYRSMCSCRSFGRTNGYSTKMTHTQWSILSWKSRNDINFGYKLVARNTFRCCQCQWQMFGLQ